MSNQFNNSWTDEEVQYVVNNYKNMTQKQIGKNIGKCHSTIAKKMAELNLVGSYKESVSWTNEEIQYLKDNYLIKSYKEMAIHLGKPQPGVEQKARRIGLKKNVEMNYTNYTDEDIQYLKDNISNKSYSEMAKHLGRNIQSIRTKCCTLGIIPSENRTKLKQEQVYFIVSNYLNYTDLELAYKFQVSETAIRDVRKEYGLKKTGNEVSGPTYIEKIIIDILDKLNIEYIYNKSLGIYKPDFLIEDKKIIIEAQGDYFHCNPYVYKDGPKDEVQIKHVLRDYYKKCFYLSSGYALIEIWELDINQDLDKVRETIKSAVLAQRYRRTRMIRGEKIWKAYS